MGLVIISQKRNQHVWAAALQAIKPDLEVGIYPNDTNREAVDFALVWHPPLGVFKHYPNIKCIASTGAGVDHILKDPGLPKGVVITRVVDKNLTQDMTSYIMTQVMCYARNILDYHRAQDKNEWLPRPYKDKSQTRIGIMGMGELGKDAAGKFLSLGFKVNGWARSKKDFGRVKVYVGAEGLAEFLGQINILVCLLPLTPATTNILNKETFAQLPKGAFIINVARGEHLVEKDLVEALDSGQLSGACLDVFREEPLPKEHIFWRHPQIIITPHIASVTNPESVAPQIVDNIKRLREGKPLINTVMVDRGY
jgi:glyoxylate/hydroxypyruvate reductase